VAELGGTGGRAFIAKNLPPGFERSRGVSYSGENFTYPFGTHIVAVDVDRETGEVPINKYVAVDDCRTQIFRC
jgi:carbon-monoxide dehydrogenase large subunit